MMTTKSGKTIKVLLAGATGYLGGYVLKELLQRGYSVTVVARNLNKIDDSIRKNPNVKIIKAELTQAESLKDCCLGIDTVISTVGITRQKEKLSYMEVDYQANRNLLEEAKKNGVRKFIYVSVFKSEELIPTAICRAKELFVAALKLSELEYCIIRPNAFFSDIEAYYNLAKKGRVLLFGNGQIKSNPIGGKDLAVKCVDAISSKYKEINIGGPEIKSQEEMAQLAFKVLHKKIKITYIPEWSRKMALRTTKIVLPKEQFGPVEFFLTAVNMEMIAPKYGKQTIEEYFQELYNRAGATQSIKSFKH